MSLLPEDIWVLLHEVQAKYMVSVISIFEAFKYVTFEVTFDCLEIMLFVRFYLGGRHCALVSGHP
jgi:hypothetical protein